MALSLSKDPWINYLDAPGGVITLNLRISRGFHVYFCAGRVDNFKAFLEEASTKDYNWLVSELLKNPVDAAPSPVDPYRFCGDETLLDLNMSSRTKGALG